MEELAPYGEQVAAPPHDPLFDAKTLQQLQSRFFTLVHRSPYEALAALEAGEAATQDPEYHERLVRLVADFHAEEAR